MAGQTAIVHFPFCPDGSTGSALFDPVHLRVLYLDAAETGKVLSDQSEVGRIFASKGHNLSEDVSVIRWRPEHVDPACEQYQAAVAEADVASGVVRRLEELGISGVPRGLASFRIVLTDRCNMSCSYCFVETNTGRPDITIDDLRKGFALLFDNNFGRDSVTYQWFGGEPLMRKDLILEADGIASELAKARNIANLKPTIVTNGTILTDILIEHFLKFKYGVGISIDGAPSANSTHRRFLSGRQTDRIIEKNIRRLLEAGVHTGANITPTTENWSDLQAALDHILGLGIRFIYVNSPIPVGGYWVADGSRWANQLQRARLYALSRGAMLFSHLDRIYQAIDSRRPRVFEHLQECGGINVALLAGGEISVLDLNWREQDLRFTIAAVREDPSILDLARKGLFPHPSCRSCFAAAVCGGPSVNDQRLRNTTSPGTEYCRFFREGTRLAVMDSSGLQ